ncbi:DNA polymerase IV [Neptuniibacter sp. 1_MG-2023]|jgi:DNA polymerase-4|uniref:DNA polymerase IV n=1 Tax=Neptuniibacter sp. 1_MG-2023 TaxID=3062662 RepID=UPI0026E27CB4|nr:DNA polymerase IV [Neptuniibacter sp. 1_MG-2023]MDO6592647.1 DNA polymerase IV [Neptuniibacter sp. 1_MG-2023]
MQRKIIHCDCDCFFAAVEMRDNPELRSIPMAIGGSADRRGVIATCNYIAREFGVRSAMSTAQALKLCPALRVVPGDMAKYRQVSQQVMSIFLEYSDIIEPLSLDEAFIDVTGLNHCQGSATLIADQIRNRVRDEVGITISAGVAPNKFLAKVASDWNKPDGIYVVHPRKVDEFVLNLPVKKISGVGMKTAEKLKKMDIETCRDLRAKSLVELVDRFGKFGQRLFDLSRGIDERPVKLSRIRKSISVEHTYSQDLLDLDSCIAQLPMLIEKLVLRYKRLQETRSIAGIVVKVKFCDFVQTTAEHQVACPNISHFRQLLMDAFNRGQRPVRLIGVGYRLTESTKEQPLQLSLLDKS